MHASFITAYAAFCSSGSTSNQGAIQKQHPSEEQHVSWKQRGVQSGTVDKGTSTVAARSRRQGLTGEGKVATRRLAAQKMGEEGEGPPWPHPSARLTLFIGRAGVSRRSMSRRVTHPEMGAWHSSLGHSSWHDSAAAPSARCRGGGLTPAHGPMDPWTQPSSWRTSATGKRSSPV